MVTTISFLAAALYLIVSGWLIWRIVRLSRGMEEGGHQDKASLLATWGGGLALHLWAVFHILITPSGLNLQFFVALTTVMLLISALLFVSAFSQPTENLGAVVLPLAALSLLAERMIPEHPTLLTAPMEVGLQVHILISLLAYSILSLSALQAVVLAYQNRHLHNHHPGGILRALPPLYTMETLLFRMIALGFVLLSLGLLTGFLFLHDIFAQHLVHKTVLSIVAWSVFAVLLWGRWRFGWRGKTAIRWTLGGFVFLMLAYFGSKLVLEIILQRA